MSENNGGDVLARGGSRATFRTAGSKVTAEQWAAIWESEAKNDTEGGSRNPDTETTGNARVDSGESVPDATGF